MPRPMHHPKSDPVPELLLERLVVGDLPPDQARDLQQRLTAEPDGAARLAAVETSNRLILQEHPVDATAAAIHRRWHLQQVARAQQPGKVRVALRWGVPALAGVVLLVGLARPALRMFDAPQGAASVALDEATSPLADSTDGVRVKGLEPHLVVFRRSATGAERLATTTGVRQGDLLQVGYVAAGRPYGVIVSVDGRGAVTQHLPEVGGGADLVRDRQHVLSHAYELDDAPEFERFFFVTSRRPIAVDTVLAAVRELARATQTARSGDLSLPGELEVHSLTLPKVQR